jgi:hypothetical protein
MSNFLSVQQVESLGLAHKQERDRRVADRRKAVFLTNKGWSYIRITEALMLDEETMRRLYKRAYRKAN